MRILIIIAASILYCSGFSNSLLAQNCLVKGMVVDYQSRQAMHSRLSFEKQPDASLTVVSESGPKGFKANLFERGLYVLMVSAPGFVTERRTFDLLHDSLAGKKDLQLQIEMIPIAVQQVLPFYQLLFEVESAAITPGALGELFRLADIMKENPGIKIQLEGYTDSKNQSSKSVALSKKRNEAIQKWLIAQGIEKSRIKMKAIGADSPVAGGSSADERKNNRRVEVRVIQL